MITLHKPTEIYSFNMSSNKTAVNELIDYMKLWKDKKSFQEMFYMKIESILELERKQIQDAHVSDRIKMGEHWTLAQGKQIHENAEKYFNNTFPKK